MNVLVTGGLGFIGSHTVVELLKKQHDVVIIDNLINSKKSVKKRIETISKKKIKFYEFDVCDYIKLEKLFKKYNFQAIIHFAGLKSVGESVQKPLEYYEKNITATINLTKLASKYKVYKFIFSSSATVYGKQQSPLNEEMELKTTTNPYGETKKISERILIDHSKSNKSFCVSILRYFNPVGSHKSGLIGEEPKGIPNNLFPVILKVLRGETDNLNVFGKDYDTKDGTGIRDYIHVVDLAIAHVKALEKIKEGVNILNLGTGKGYSVLEIINAFEKYGNRKIPHKFVERRPGDLGEVYSNVDKAKLELNWNSKNGLKEMVEDSLRFNNKK